MKKAFINKYGQLRSGWKISIVMVFILVFTFILSTVLGISAAMLYMRSAGGDLSNISEMVNRLTAQLSSNPVLLFFNHLIMPVSTIAATFLALKVVDRKKVVHIGVTSIKKDSRDLVYGLVLGAVSMAVIFFILLATKNISLSNTLSTPKFSYMVLTGLVWFLFVGFAEEFFGRGYCMVVLHQSRNIWVTLIVSSIIFSLLHGSNPNVRPLGLVNIFIVGLLFAFMFLRTGNIWMPVGYHITWNYFQGIVFGFPVSGMALNGIYRIDKIDDNLLTGGAFGPEAGILSTAVIAIGFLLVWRYTSTRRTTTFNIEM